MWRLGGTCSYGDPALDPDTIRYQVSFVETAAAEADTITLIRKHESKPTLLMSMDNLEITCDF